MLKGIITIVGFAVVALGLLAISYVQSAAPVQAAAPIVVSQTTTMTETVAMTEEMEAEVEMSMDMAQVPHIVAHVAMMAAEQFVPGASMEGVEFDPEGENPAYEFAGTNADGMEIEIDVLPSGMLSEVEEVIADTDVPAEAMDMVSLIFPESTVDLVERSMRPTQYGLMSVYYEFEITTADGVAYDVEVNEAGSMITIETTE